MIAAAVGVASLIGAYLGRNQILRLWVPSSENALAQSEAKMLELSQAPREQHNVRAGGDLQLSTVKVPCRARAANSSSGTQKRPALVLLAGFGGGKGLWCLNFDELSQHYDIYAPDLLGFGLSSRPAFTAHGDGQAATHYWVDALEAWRRELDIEKMVLLGHSLGGYVATNYAIAHPTRVLRLVLVSPFGVLRETGFSRVRQMPFLFRFFFRLFQSFSPQAVVRAMGPVGPKLMKRFRGRYDNGRYRVQDERVSEYVYQLTSFNSGSGDYAFMSLVDKENNVRLPTIERLARLRAHAIRVTAIFGEVDRVVPNSLVEIRRALDGDRDRHSGSGSDRKAGGSGGAGLVDGFVIDQAGHHAYATHAREFHQAVLSGLQGDLKALSATVAAQTLAVDAGDRKATAAGSGAVHLHAKPALSPAQENLSDDGAGTSIAHEFRAAAESVPVLADI